MNEELRDIVPYLVSPPSGAGDVYWIHLTEIKGKNRCITDGGTIGNEIVAITYVHVAIKGCSLCALTLIFNPR